MSFTSYLSRKSVNAYHKKVYKSIISIIRKLIDLAPYDIKGVLTFKQKVKTTHPHAEREWLLEQVLKKSLQ